MTGQPILLSDEDVRALASLNRSVLLGLMTSAAERAASASRDLEAYIRALRMQVSDD